jgi:hypothetical protein
MVVHCSYPCHWLKQASHGHVCCLNRWLRSNYWVTLVIFGWNHDHCLNWTWLVFPKQRSGFGQGVVDEPRKKKDLLAHEDQIQRHEKNPPGEFLWECVSLSQRNEKSRSDSKWQVHEWTGKASQKHQSQVWESTAGQKHVTGWAERRYVVHWNTIVVLAIASSVHVLIRSD